MVPASWKTAGAADVVVPHKLLAGLRVLVVDDDPTCLMILEKMLKKCNYQATICNRAEIGLSMLRENTNGYDIVLSDVHMPDMDGFKLLEQIGLEMDLPVIMMSADDSKSVVMKGVTHGACDYLIKPVRIEALRNIWQHVVRRRKHDWKNVQPPSTSADDADQRQRVPEDVEVLKSANEGHTWKDAKRRKADEDEAEAETEEREESSSKKPRVVWSVELHQQFVAAVNQLGIDKAVPKKILELMNVQGLTRENIASHLQKYRLYLKRVSGSQHLGSIDALFMDSPDAGYGSTSSLNGLELRALAAGGQSLATIQAALLGRSNNSKYPISVPVIDQKNIYTKSRYGGEAGSQQLLHGIPTNIEPKQFVGLHQSHHHSFNIVNGQNQFQNHSNSNQYISWQPVSPNGMLTHGLGGYKTLNDLNQMRPYDSGFQDIGATSGKKTGASISLSADEENRSQWANAKGKSVEQYDQDDLLTAILKQQQQGFGQPEKGFGFDGCYT